MFKSKKKTQEIVKKEDECTCDDGCYCSFCRSLDAQNPKLKCPDGENGGSCGDRNLIKPLEIIIETTTHDVQESNGSNSAGCDQTVTVLFGGQIFMKSARPTLEDWADVLISIYGSGVLTRVNINKVVKSIKF